MEKEERNSCKCGFVVSRSFGRFLNLPQYCQGEDRLDHFEGDPSGEKVKGRKRGLAGSESIGRRGRSKALNAVNRKGGTKPSKKARMTEKVEKGPPTPQLVPKGEKSVKGALKAICSSSSVP